MLQFPLTLLPPHNIPYPMNDQIKNRLKRTAILAVIALIIGAGVGYYQVHMENLQIIRPAEKPEQDDGIMNIAGLQVGGPYALVDENGEQVSEKTYQGQYKLVFFGFTFCPDVCPAELQKMAKVLEALGPRAERITPLFITVDPARDTPEVMKEYTDQFDARIIGLTGTEDQIDLMEKNFRVFAAKAEDENLSEYTMNHSSFTYLMGPQDEFLGLYRSEDDAIDIAADIEKKLAQD